MLANKEQALADALEMLDSAATILYNIEGDQFQRMFEQVQDVIDELSLEVD